MDRRRFLQNLVVTTATIQDLVRDANPAKPPDSPTASSPVTEPDGAARAAEVDTAGYTHVAEFKIGAIVWKVYEDLRTRDGSIVFISSQGATRALPKSAEATFDEASTPYLG